MPCEFSYSRKKLSRIRSGIVEGEFYRVIECHGDEKGGADIDGDLFVHAPVDYGKGDNVEDFIARCCNGHHDRIEPWAGKDMQMIQCFFAKKYAVVEKCFHDPFPPVYIFLVAGMI